MRSFFKSYFFSLSLGLICLGALLLSSCNKDAVAEHAALNFKQLLPANTGIDFSNSLKPTTELNILNYIYYYNGAGVATADFNNDGLLDLYFTANQSPDALYLNKGEMQFENLTTLAGIDNASGWTTGVTVVDINHDGWMDIYISKVSGYRGLEGHNLLYINQGVSEGTSLSFKEASAQYGLNFSGFSTQASFFDYDLDGDLDLYLLNHAVQPNSNYGRGSKRQQIDSLSGDRLYQNQEGIFVDKSQEAGIFQGNIGYGLGLSVADLNQDGYPDIYVGNDFFENDYLYINQQDGTFKEVISSEQNPLGHTTHYSMGNDIADVNNDGLVDIVSVDMLPEDLQTLKTSGVEFGFQIYQNYLKNGYEPQYMQNALHLNRGSQGFSEVAYMSGVASTDWSWAPLLADFNNDGLKDLFITNGILGATNDMDFINFIANDNIQKALSQGMTQTEMDFISKMPQKKTSNYLYLNSGAGSFSNQTQQWLGNQPSFSNGAVYADLDNDGYLDLAINNVNEPAGIYQNQSRNKQQAANYLAVELRGSEKNRFGVGATVSLFTPEGTQLKQHFVSRGYLSAVSNRLNFGLGSQEIVDSLSVLWPDGTLQTIKAIAANQKIKINKRTYDPNKNLKTVAAIDQLLSEQQAIQLPTHKDNPSIDFNRDPLIPYAQSNVGPALAVGDLNADGLEDVFLGGGKGQAGQLSFQDAQGGFSKVSLEYFLEDAISEDIAALVLDANNDGLNDLVVVSGGNEFTSGPALAPRLYLNGANGIEKSEKAFNNIFVDASSVSAVDFEGDGDQDLLITSALEPRSFGAVPRQWLLVNNGAGIFLDQTDNLAAELKSVGNVKDAKWVDLNKDGWQDLIVVGHWMAPRIFINHHGKLQLEERSLSSFTGLWNQLTINDFDNDGDLDFIAANWGLNSRLTASSESPLRLYKNDFDNNGSKETLVTYYYKGIETPFASKDELVKQMPSLNKSFLSYEKFAAASLQDLFSAEALEDSEIKEVTTLATSYFENTGNGQFIVSSLPFWAQISQVNDIFVADFNDDSFADLYLVGNHHFLSTQLGRLDASKGELLLGNGNGQFKTYSGPLPAVNGMASAIKEIRIGSEQYLVIALNNKPPKVVKVNKKTSNE